MSAIQAFNLKRWIDANRHLLKPPVGNKQVFKDAEFIIMAIGGPNSRKDFHDDPGDIEIREGDVLLLPPHVPHSPQRFANTVGLVVERQRQPGEKDGFLWYCENCSHELYSEYFELENIETQLAPLFERFFASLDKRTCKHCGAVMQPPKRATT